jgi:hypothetical protein
MKLFDSVRTMLNVRTVRSVPPPGPKPRLGARIVKDDVRITVQAGLTDATWSWLVQHGWREDSFRSDRRRYRDVPPSLVAQIFDAADADACAHLIRRAVAEARVRPIVNLSRR